MKKHGRKRAYFRFNYSAPSVDSLKSENLVRNYQMIFSYLSVRFSVEMFKYDVQHYQASLRAIFDNSEMRTLNYK